MKITLSELRAIIREAAKSVSKDGAWKPQKFEDTGSWASPIREEEEEDLEEKSEVQPRKYSRAENMEYKRTSETADGNLYARQGAANMGPFTEGMLRQVIRGMVREEIGKRPQRAPRVRPTGNIWEDLSRTVTEASSGHCNCESTKCDHGGMDDWKPCKRPPGSKKAMYVGALCDKCAANMPKEYMLPAGGASTGPSSGVRSRSK